MTQQLHRHVFTIEYDGTSFDCGWQKQKSVKSSVQGTLEKAAFELTGETVKFVASGRTDRNVHALNQIVHADFAKRQTVRAFTHGMNWYLRESGCRVLDVYYCDDPKFHARFSAKKKIYEYVICYSKVCSVFDQNRCWWISNLLELDFDLFRESAAFLVGDHNFSSFRDASCQAKSPFRTVDSLDITQDRTIIKLQFKGRSFLHKQIRIMVGTLVDLARGRTMDDMQTIIAAEDRSKAGQTAPGYGLFLKEVLFS